MSEVLEYCHRCLLLKGANSLCKELISLRREAKNENGGVASQRVKAPIIWFTPMNNVPGGVTEIFQE